MALNCASGALEGARGASEGPPGGRGDAGERRGERAAGGSRVLRPDSGSVLAGRWGIAAALRQPRAPIAPDGLTGRRPFAEREPAAAHVVGPINRVVRVRRAAALAEREPAPGERRGVPRTRVSRSGRQQPLNSAEFGRIPAD